MRRSLVALAALALGALFVAAPADAAQYEFLIKPGTAQLSAIVVRLNTSSGQGLMSNGGQAYVAVTDAAAPPSGDYHLLSYSTLDNGAATQEWDFYRVDARSGRSWYLSWDAKTAPAWIEIPLPH